MFKNYWRRIAVRAWAETMRSLGFDSRNRVLSALFTFLIVVIALLIWGSQDSAGDMALERGVVWGLAVLAFPFVYVWQFLLTPAKIDEEKNKSIETLVVSA